MCSASSSKSMSTSEPSALMTFEPKGVVGSSNVVTALIKVLCVDRMLGPLVKVYILVGWLREP